MKASLWPEATKLNRASGLSAPATGLLPVGAEVSGQAGEGDHDQHHADQFQDPVGDHLDDQRGPPATAATTGRGHEQRAVGGGVAPDAGHRGQQVARAEDVGATV